MDNDFLSEKKLLAELKRGDEDSFGKLYKIYSKPLYLSICVLVKSEELAMDVIQDVFMRVWRNRKQIDVEKNFKAYLYVIANNLVKDFFRKVNNDQKLKSYYLNLGIDSHYNVEPYMDYKEIQDLLTLAMDTLNDTERSVFVLCKLEGRSYNEAAGILGLSPSTIGNNLVKATLKIRQYLSGSLVFWMLIYSSI